MNAFTDAALIWLTPATVTDAAVRTRRSAADFGIVALIFALGDWFWSDLAPGFGTVWHIYPLLGLEDDRSLTSLQIGLGMLVFVIALILADYVFIAVIGRAKALSDAEIEGERSASYLVWLMLACSPILMAVHYLSGLVAGRSLLLAKGVQIGVLAAMCAVAIAVVMRLYRDKIGFNRFGLSLLPVLAAVVVAVIAGGATVWGLDVFFPDFGERTLLGDRL